MPIVVMRHGERVDYVDASWVAQSPRPWDPPLTDEGKDMAVRAGAAIRGLCEAHGLPAPSILLSSPLLRCVETSAGAGRGMGFEGKIGIEPALCETICEAWFRSWGAPGADGTWGGPAGCGLGVPVAESELHPAALGPVGDLFHAPTTMAQVSGAAIDLSYEASRAAASLDYCWARYEAQHGTDSSTGSRIGGFCAQLEERHGGERTIVVCTHGQDLKENVGYTALHLLVRDKETGGWEALVSGSADHVQR